MPGGGTCTFFEPDHYEASLRQAQIELVAVPRGEFKARLTRADLHHLRVLRCEEDPPRVGYLHLTQRLSFVTFSVHSGPLPVGAARNYRRMKSCSTAAANGCIRRRWDTPFGT